MENSVRRHALILARVAAFLLTFLLLLNLLSIAFVPKYKNDQSGMIGYITKSFKGEPKDSIDVFFVGNSDAYRGISPMEIWGQNGISSCVSGKGNQNPRGAYKMLKDMYETQSPKVVVIETDMLFDTVAPAFSYTSAKNNISNFSKFLKTNFSNLDDALSTGISYYFPILHYHDRWQNIKINDFTNRRASYNFQYKGFISDFSVEGYNNGFSYMSETDNNSQMSRRTKSQLNKMIKLCHENGSEVVLLEVPSASSWSNAKHNEISLYAKQNNIRFIDMNFHGAVPEFDWATDTKDGGDHLNTYGAAKVSRCLAGYLTDAFNLPDHRNDAAYSRFESSYVQYKADLEKNQNVSAM